MPAEDGLAPDRDAHRPAEAAHPSAGLGGGVVDAPELLLQAIETPHGRREIGSDAQGDFEVAA